MSAAEQHTLEHWAEQLLALEHGPAYVNGVPVRRWASEPVRFEVSIYELTSEVGLGCGSRIRKTLIMTLWEAARFVRAGRFPHFRYCRSTDRWSEVA